MENIYPGQRKREAALDAYARYLCRDWNTHHSGQEQSTFQIFFVTLPDYQNTQPEKLLGEYACGEHSGDAHRSFTTIHAYAC